MACSVKYAYIYIYVYVCIQDVWFSWLWYLNLWTFVLRTCRSRRDIENVCFDYFEHSGGTGALHSKDVIAPSRGSEIVGRRSHELWSTLSLDSTGFLV